MTRQRETGSSLNTEPWLGPWECSRHVTGCVLALRGGFELLVSSGGPAICTCPQGADSCYELGVVRVPKAETEDCGFRG